MTKKEIIQLLSGHPDDVEVKVFTQDPYDGRYDFNMKDLDIHSVMDVHGYVRIILDR